MTLIADPASVPIIRVTLPEPFAPGWNRVQGITVDGTTMTIDAGMYFWRYDNPTWLLCDWEEVRRELLAAVETPAAALEQQVLDYIGTHGRSTADPGKVLRTAWHVYSYLFRPEQLADPDLADVDPAHLRILVETGTMMSLNRVELTGKISNVAPAWFFAATAQVVFGLDDAEAQALDDLYHGGFFNERRRVESIRAHAALGGRLVHGCQSAPNQSGGVVAPYGTDIAQFTAELATFKDEWLAAVRAQR